MPSARAIGKAVIAALIFLACLAPWMIRNWNVFHAFIPIRGNLGAELHDSVLESYERLHRRDSRSLYAMSAPSTSNTSRWASTPSSSAKASSPANTSALTSSAFSSSRSSVFIFTGSVSPSPPEKGVLNEAFRVLNYSFISLAASSRPRARAEAAHSGSDPLRVGLRVCFLSPTTSSRCRHAFAIRSNPS